MSLTDWNWLLEPDRQDYPWDCSACSTAWAMRTVGYEATEQSVIAGLGPSRISPTYGLLDASGAGLVSYLAEVGITAENNPDASWEELQAAGGFQPMIIGGRKWNHWVGVRMASWTLGTQNDGWLALMNPAPGWMDVWQLLSEWDSNGLGPWSAVWFTSW